MKDMERPPADDGGNDVVAGEIVFEKRRVGGQNRLNLIDRGTDDWGDG